MLLRNSTEVGERHTIEVQQADDEVHGRGRRGPDPPDHLEPRHQRPAGDARRRHAAPERAREDATAAGRVAVLQVEDEGVGIAPEEVDAIFQPFRGSFGKGTGLGLAIVHRIVTDYGGRIDVQPRRGGGTMFRVSFPERADAHAERQAS